MITWFKESCAINGSAINVFPENVWFTTKNSGTGMCFEVLENAKVKDSEDDLLKKFREYVDSMTDDEVRESLKLAEEHCKEEWN